MEWRIIEIAAQAIRIPTKVAETHFKKIENMDAYYFWSPGRGGLAVIVSSDGEKLAATSAVNYEKHLKAFLDGKRN